MEKQNERNQVCTKILVTITTCLCFQIPEEIQVVARGTRLTTIYVCVYTRVCLYIYVKHTYTHAH